MFRFLKDFIDYLKMKNQRRVACKRFLITQAMIKYYSDLQKTKGSVELPPFILAVNAVQELKTDKQINRMYRKLELAGMV